MLIRIGIPASFRRFSAAANGLGVSMLVSANALFDHDRRRFRQPAPDLFGGGDVALDSAGFVAMVKYGDYPWSPSAYVGLAGSFPWAWWASMDFCCEPEIAPNRAEVRSRVARTVDMLAEVRTEAAFQGVAPPMPVLQGWHPDDYLRCAETMGELPALVGMGSVCRRQEDGPSGVVTIVRELDAVLPRHVRFHLFGVKGPAAVRLARHRRLASIDSAAWDREPGWYYAASVVDTASSTLKVVSIGGAVAPGTGPKLVGTNSSGTTGVQSILAASGGTIGWYWTSAKSGVTFTGGNFAWPDLTNITPSGGAGSAFAVGAQIASVP